MRSSVSADGFALAVEGRYDLILVELQAQFNLLKKQEWERLRQIAGEVDRAVNTPQWPEPVVRAQGGVVIGIAGQTEVPGWGHGRAARGSAKRADW
jgi:hypothetical protein